jgi:pescadillo protein
LAAFTLEGRRVNADSEQAEQKTLTNGHAPDGNSEALQAQIDKLAQEVTMDEETKPEPAEEQNDTEAIDSFTPVAPEGDSLPQPDRTGDQASALFSNCTFFISREAPRHPVEFLLRAFGCKRIGWDAVLGEGAFTHDETDPRITHQVVDRPVPAQQPLPALQGQEDAKDQTLQVVKPGYIMPGRTYIQPQWIWDCVNEGKLLRADLYAPGETLPPHLSPWIKPTSGQYDPRATLEEQEMEGEADEAVEVEEDDAAGVATDEDDEDQEDESEDDDEVDAGDMDVASSADDSDEVEDEVDTFAGFHDAADEDSEAASDLDQEAQHQKELEAEASGRPIPVSRTQEEAQKLKARQTRKAAQTKKDEEVERQKMMMSNKKRKLFEKMQHSNTKRDVEAEKLRSKRRKLERTGKNKA